MNLFSLRTPTRRLALQGFAAMVVVSVTGCGFRLRGSGVTLAFSSLQFAGSGSRGLVQRLTNQLEASGVRIVAPTPQANGEAPAQVVLTIELDQRERVVVGGTASGQVRELELRQRVHFHLRTVRGRSLLEDVALQQMRELSYSETEALAKAAEESLLFDDMLSSLARQIMMRLAAVPAL